MLTLSDQPVGLAGDGRFFIAFDRDAAPRQQLTARLGDGRMLARSITVTPRAWQIERIPIGPKPGTPPSEAYARLRSGELDRINAARATDHPIDGWRQKFIWPVHGRLTGKFGSQRIYNGVPGSYHSGLDIATGEGGAITTNDDKIYETLKQLRNHGSKVRYMHEMEGFLLGQDAKPDQIAQLRADLGLDQPFFIQYGHFLVNAVQGEFGLSLRQGAKVSRLIAERFPATLELALMAAGAALLIGIPMGVYTALRRHSALSHVFMTVSLSVTCVLFFLLVLFFELMVVFAKLVFGDTVDDELDRIREHISQQKAWAYMEAVTSPVASAKTLLELSYG